MIGREPDSFGKGREPIRQSKVLSIKGEAKMEQEPKERKNFGGRQTRLSELQRQRYSQERLDPLRQLCAGRSHL